MLQIWFGMNHKSEKIFWRPDGLKAKGEHFFAFLESTLFLVISLSLESKFA